MTTVNPAVTATNPIVLSICEGIIFQYASEVVLQEGKFANSGGSGLFTQYEKRQTVAKKIMENPKLYAKQLAYMIEMIEPNIYFNTAGSSTDLYRYLWDSNPTGKHVCEAFLDTANWTNVGNATGTSVFDAIAGISNADTL